MSIPAIRTDRSAFDRIRDAILNRGDGDEENRRRPGTPTPG